jgi:N-acetyl-anhydromuramyl-L-alanine amidase AmpD
MREIRLWHTRDNRWSDIGYHFVIDRDGAVVSGRPVEKAGAHVVGRNAASIGVCLIGGHGSAATDAFPRHFTQEQDRALRALIVSLRSKHGALAVSGHNQWAAKACPGFNVPAWHNGKG